MKAPDAASGAVPNDHIVARLLSLDQLLEQKSARELETAAPASAATERAETSGQHDAGTASELADVALCLQSIEALRLAFPQRMAAIFRAPSAGNCDLAHLAEFALRGGDEASHPPQLGRFRLIRPLGQGGYGIVFLAQDTTLGRYVALKVPRPEVLLTPDLRRRFLREAEAAAALDHAHIVPVFEAGMAGPICYIAAAYCPGISLSHWLQRGQAMPPHGAAEVVAILANAVQHAHDRGVLHRDIKPGNVLIEEDAQRAGGLRLESVRLTDFGLARVLSDSSEDSLSLATIGTPAYMAPEQAANHRHEIDVRTDVYGLGATLYHLLTGRPPIVGGSQAETLSAILRVDPLDPRSYRPGLPRDLVAVCLKCLEKDRRRRYDSSADLAADLGRYLVGQPVQARPLGPGLRLVKWARRHPARAAWAATSAVAIALVITVAFVGWWSTSQALAREKAALKEADLAYRETQEAVDRYFVTVSENQLLHKPGMTPLRHDLLQTALEYYSSFVARHDGDTAAASELCKAHIRLAQVRDELGDIPAAIEAYQRALQLCDAQQPAGHKSGLPSLQAGMIHRKLAHAYRRINQPDVALTHAEQSTRIHRQLLEAANLDEGHHDQLAQALHAQAAVVQTLGQVELASALYEEAAGLVAGLLERGIETPEYQLRLAQLRGNQSIMMRLQGQIETSRALLFDATRIYQQLVDEYPDMPTYRESLGKALANLSLYASQQRDFETALSQLGQATAQFDQLAEEFPQVAIYSALRASTRREAAALHIQLDQRPSAMALLRQAVAVLEPLTERSPEQFDGELAEARLGLGDLLLQQGDLDSARALIDQATERLEALQQAMPHDFFSICRLIMACEHQARVRLEEAQSDVALAWLVRAEELLGGLRTDAPQRPQLENLQASLRSCRAAVEQLQSAPAREHAR